MLDVLLFTECYKDQKEKRIPMSHWAIYEHSLK